MMFMANNSLLVGIAALVIVLLVLGAYLLMPQKPSPYIPNNNIPNPSPNPNSPINYSQFSKSINGSNNFALNVYSSLNNESGNQTSNIFFSPFSVYTALSMTAEGAGGSTLQEMRSVLGLPDNLSATHASFEKLFGILNSQKGINLSIADSIWVEKTFSINQGFSSNLSTYYDASAYQADFKNNPNLETTNINSWIANKTNQKIKNMIAPGVLNSFTEVVLVNAIYFNGTWEQKFNKRDTQNATFFVAPTVNVTVPLMFLGGTYESYYANNGLQALELNYNESNVSMLILLPTQKYNLSAIETGLSAREVYSIESNLSSQDMDIWLPRFNTTKSEDMNTLLQALGIKSAFDPYSANFSRISTNESLYISHVLHEAFIKVTENGTEAAGATVVSMDTTAVLNLHPIQPIDFRADHPFLFFIIDKQTGTILFMGRESDPAKSN